MNIKQVKEEIKNTIYAYHTKDEYNNYKIPSVHQRPILLIGPPGIGKTAIMEQIARECGIGLVSYTITHHTRQSAIGLPYIEKKQYGQKEYTITEYTMSEIIASVYEKIEATGIQEGILFIDEINCVSETLAPTMLQFLQGKTFGNHKVPEGYIIVAAGNPPEYNKSVHEFDIVTLDRVKKIHVTQDLTVWKEYAYQASVHNAIISYLEWKKENFYVVETTVDGKSFVTARGWEDLSALLTVYEQLELSIEEETIEEYIQHSAIAKDFFNYLVLYYKYKEDYQIRDMLQGNIPNSTIEQLKEAPLEERFSIVSLLLGALTDLMTENYKKSCYMKKMFTNLKAILSILERDTKDSVYTIWTDFIQTQKEKYEKKCKGGLVTKEEEQTMTEVLERMNDYEQQLKKGRIQEKRQAVEFIRHRFEKEVEQLDYHIKSTKEQLEHAFSAIIQCFGEGQELVIFLTELTTNFYSMKFISENGSESYYEYNKLLLLHDTKKELLEEIKQAKQKNYELI